MLPLALWFGLIFLIAWFAPRLFVALMKGSAFIFGSFLLLLLLNWLNHGNSGSSRSSWDRKNAAWVMAQQFVKDRLKSPSSASFGSALGDYQDPDRVVSDLGGGEFRIRAWVEAQNSFGATIRTTFVCELEDTGAGNWRCTSLQMSE